MRNTIIYLLVAFMIMVSSSCNKADERGSAHPFASNEQIERLLSDAQFDYLTKFQSFLEVHPFFKSPQWDEYDVKVYNDTCAVISIPVRLEGADSLHSSYTLNIVSKMGAVNYYLLCSQSLEKDSASCINDVLLCTFSATEMTVYKGAMMGEMFDYKEKSVIQMPYATISSRSSCGGDCHYGGDGWDMDGGSLPDVIITPDPGTGGGYGTGWWDDWWWYWPIHSGGSIPPEGGSYPNIDKRFPKGSTLDDQGNDDLEKALDDLTSDCIYGAIDDFITENNFWKGGVSMGTFGDAAVTANGNLIFGESDNINVSALAHEWIHLYQRIYGSVDIFNSDYTGMAEFELALFQDITIYAAYGSLYRPDSSLVQTSSWINNISAPNVQSIRQSYEKWISQLCAGMKLPASINENDFLEWSIKFGEYSRIYSNLGYKYGNANYGTNIINSLLSKIKGKCLD